MKKRSLFLLLASALTLASCGKDEVPPGGQVDSVSISQSSIEVQSGKRSTDVTVTLEGKGEYNKFAKLVSQDETIAKTSFTEVESGSTFKVYGIAPGSTTISVISKQDESKATSLSVTVKAKEEAPEYGEIVSVSLSKETHLFHESDQPLEVTATLVGRGVFDDTIELSLSENSAVTLSKTELKSGESFTVTPSALSNGELTTIKASSKEEPAKYSELLVRVDEDIEEIDPASEITLNSRSVHLSEGGASFTVTATTGAGSVNWSWKEADATEYVEFVGTPSGDTARVQPKKATPEGKVATLVASVGNHSAECKFTVTEKVKEYRTYYLSNNSFLNYSKVYFYTWGENGEENATYPGEELTNVVKNTLGEDCYEFYVDIAKYSGFKFSDGNDKETVDAYFSSFGSNNNVWYDGEGAHFAQIAKDEPTVAFHSNSVSVYSGESAIAYTFDVRKGDAEYEITSGADKISVTDFSNGSISVAGVAVGSAAIRVYIPETEAEDYLYVEVLDASTVKSFYFSNNKGWSQVFAYAWKGQETMTWPGVELTNPLKNTGGEDVYLVHVANKYDHVILNNGQGAQTVDISIEDTHFASNDNVYLLDDQDDLGHYKIGFANFEGFGYSVAFASASATVYDGKNVRVGVTAIGSGVTYNVTVGSDVVQLAETSDNHIILKWLKTGTAKVVASLHGVKAELAVTCASGEAPDTDVTLYFTNNYNWSEVYLYAWGSASSNGWPGVKLENPVYNTDSIHVYEFKVDTSVYDKFLINDGGHGGQTVDISIDATELASNNNIYPTGTKDDSGHCNIGYATLATAAATVEATFTCNYDTGNNGDLYIVLIRDPFPQVWLKMTWTDGNNWTLTHEFAVGANITFKVVVGRSSGDVWEGGSDRTWTIPDHADTYVCHWQA